MLSNKKKLTNRAGGSATGGGMNFQASITAIAYVHMASGRPLGWLDGQAIDTPVSVKAETGGAGDDIALVLQDGKTVEIQVKKGLASGPGLWESLTKLAIGINSKEFDYGVLIVCPNTSATIRKDLAKDLKEMSETVTMTLKPITKKLDSKLNVIGISLKEIASRIRIVTLHSLETDSASVQTAKANLLAVCGEHSQIDSAWDRLYREATRSIELRATRTVTSIFKALSLAGISLKADSTAPIDLVAKISDWVLRTNSSFTIYGISHKFSMREHWIETAVKVAKKEGQGELEPLHVLEQYHSWSSRIERSRDDQHIAPETLGKFIRHCVVSGGPGLGKSTLLHKLAHVYSSHGFPVLFVDLKRVSARVNQLGSSVEESLFVCGLDGSGLDPKEVMHTNIADWIILCDGLDECGEEQEKIADGLSRFIAGHPLCRVIVSTRPIGYKTRKLTDWRHYNLLPLNPDHGPKHAKKLFAKILGEGTPAYLNAHSSFQTKLDANQATSVAARSPLLLGLMVSLATRSIDWGDSKSSLYESLFHLIQELPRERSTLQGMDFGTQELNRSLDIVGWLLQDNPLNSAAKIVSAGGVLLAKDFGFTNLRGIQIFEKHLKCWEDIGILEKLQHNGTHLFTFVHRTFSEYAAARYLASLNETQFNEAITNLIDLGDWEEVFIFLASLGKAENLIEIYNKNYKFNEVNASQFGRILRILTNSSCMISPEFSHQIIDTVLAKLPSKNKVETYKGSFDLLELCGKYSDRIAPIATQFIDHPQKWTRLCAWTLLCKCGRKYYEFEKLISVFKEIPVWLGKTETSFLNRKIGLSESGQRDILNVLILQTTKEIVVSYSNEDAVKLIESVFDREFGQSIGLIGDVQDIANNAGLSNLRLDKKFKNNSLFFEPEKYKAAVRHADKCIFEDLLIAVGLPSSGNSPVQSDSPLLNLSAFLRISGFMDIVVSDVWNWKDPYDHAAVQEIFRAAMDCIELDREELVIEIESVIEAIKHEAPRSWGWLQRTRCIDIGPETQIHLKDSQHINAYAKALFHPSEWIVQLAAQLLVEVNNNELRPIILDALKNGEDLTFWAVSAIVEHTKNKDGVKAILERLQIDLTRGSEYLFPALKHLSENFLSVELISVLQKGLLSESPTIALAAAKLTGNVAEDNSASIKNLLEDALSHWKTKETPSPKTGIVPTSPRAEILKALFVYRNPTNHELVELASDVRSDVQEIAKPLLLTKLRKDDDFRSFFLSKISSGEAQLGLLINALQEQIPFEKNHVNNIIEMLKDPDPNIRHAASYILDKIYLNDEELRELSKVLEMDTEEQIRDRVFNYSH